MRRKTNGGYGPFGCRLLVVGLGSHSTACPPPTPTDARPRHVRASWRATLANAEIAFDARSNRVGLSLQRDASPSIALVRAFDGSRHAMSEHDVASVRERLPDAEDGAGSFALNADEAAGVVVPDVRPPTPRVRHPSFARASSARGEQAKTPPADDPPPPAPSPLVAGSQRERRRARPHRRG